jgi:formylglycine-generating enzyme required for sulfatase activity
MPTAKPRPYVEPHLQRIQFKRRPRKQTPQGLDIESDGPYREVRKAVWTGPDVEWIDDRGNTNETQIANQEITKLLRLALRAERWRRRPHLADDAIVGLRLCIMEDASQGKTVFTHRLCHYFVDHDPQAGRAQFFWGQAPLVFRWESHRDEHARAWPQGNEWDQVKAQLLQRMEDELSEVETNSQPSAKAALDMALRLGRVVLIFDAADQADETVRPTLVNILQAEPFRRCHVVITGRRHVFRLHGEKGICDPKKWTYAAIAPFDANQQLRFLWHEMPKSNTVPGPIDVAPLDDLFHDHNALSELLAVPGLLSMVGDLVKQEVEKSKPEERSFQKLDAIRTRCDLQWMYWNRITLGKAVNNANLEESYEEYRNLWQLMLCRTAFEFVLQGRMYLEQGDVKAVKTRVEEYVARRNQRWASKDEKFWSPRWQELIRISSLAASGAFEHTSLEHPTLIWRHASVRDWFCGLFLALYFDEQCFSHEEQQLVRDRMLKLAIDAQAKWIWKTLFDLPRTRHRPQLAQFFDCDPVAAHDAAYRSACKYLFAPNRHARRPTERMYEAWVLFEEERLLGESPFGSRLKDTGEAVIADFQAQFQARLRCHELVEDFRLDPANLNKKLAEQDDFAVAPSKGKNKTKAQLARELVPDHTRRRPWFATMLRRLAQLFGRLTGIRTPHQTEFVRCPPAGKQHDRTASPDDVVALREAVTTELSKLADVLSKDDLPIDQRLCVLARRDRIVRLYGAKGEKAQDLEWFFQGSPDGVGYDDERPQHKVWLQPFWMLTTPVTVEQYCGLFDLQHHAEFKDGFRQYASDPRCPVILTDWYDSFCFALFVGAELPAETEWEYACRAGTETKYWFGDSESELEHHAWYSKNSGNRTHVVGELASHGNPWGLFEMHGNVWEWCLDWWDGAAAYQDRIDKAGGRKIGSIAVVDDRLVEFVGGGSRVLRGGSVCVVAVFCRSARRGVLRPGLRDVIGFRLLVRG